MTVKLLAAGVSAVAAVGAAAAGVTSVVSAGVTSVAAVPAAVQVQHVALGTPLPLEPAPAPAAALPTADQVSGLLTRLTEPSISYKEKGDLVENGITQQEGHELDHKLRKSERDGELPYTFDVTSVEPAGPNQAAASVNVSGPKMNPPETKQIMLVDQGGWVLSHDSALELIRGLSTP